MNSFILYYAMLYYCALSNYDAPVAYSSHAFTFIIFSVSVAAAAVAAAAAAELY